MFDVSGLFLYSGARCAFSTEWGHSLKIRVTAIKDMKKTISILFALCSCAVASEPVELKWDNNAASITATNALTAVFTIDLTSMIGAESPEDMDCPVLTFTGTYTGAGNSYVGTYGLYGMYSDLRDTMGWQERYIFDKTPGYRNNGELVNMDTEYESYDTATSATIVYSYGAIEGSSVMITLWDSNGNNVYDYSYSLENKGSVTSIYALEKHHAIGKIDIYDTVLEGGEIDEAIVRLNNSDSSQEPSQPSEPSVPSQPEFSPTVPEPTTATLSLLALAGLAARRRRH